jgi:hypothetical protein
MSMKSGPRLPLGPLLEITGLDTATSPRQGTDWHDNPLPQPVGRQPAPLTLLAEHLQVSLKSVGRWSRYGIPLKAAEAACDYFGLHPCEVWFDDYLEVAV